MNLFLREMKVYRKSLIIWCIGIIAIVGSGMGKYAGLSSSGQSMNDLMASMPKSLQAIMGIGTLDISTASGYYGILYAYLLLMATIHAVMLGATIISKEERDKTAEFLNVKPISRNKIITMKLGAAFVNIVLFNMIAWISSNVIVGKYSKGESVGDDITMTMVSMFILQLLFLVIGTAISAISKSPKATATLSTAILFITYILSVAIDLNDQLEGLKYVTPFKYFEAKNVMYGGGLDVVFVIISVVMIFVLFVVTYVFYNKRDLKI